MKEDDSLMQAGLGIRRTMFGAAGADDRLASAEGVARDLEEYVTRSCFGSIWARPHLDLKTRSLLTLAVLTALGKPNQLKVHVQGALANGASPDEIREAILQTLPYSGIPAGIEALKAAGEILPATPHND